MGALRLDVVTIFPDYLKVLDLSLIGRAAGDGLITPVVHDLREWADDRRRTVDGPPVGGGAGMVMRPDVWGRALDRVLAAPIGGAATSGGTAPRTGGAARRVLVMPAPSGDLFTQRTAEDLAGADQIVFACGRYEGIDARVAEHYRDAGVEVRELSIGDYVLGGGEGPGCVRIGLEQCPHALGGQSHRVEGGVCQGLEHETHPQDGHDGHRPRRVPQQQPLRVQADQPQGRRVVGHQGPCAQPGVVDPGVEGVRVVAHEGDELAVPRRVGLAEADDERVTHHPARRGQDEGEDG